MSYSIASTADGGKGRSTETYVAGGGNCSSGSGIRWRRVFGIANWSVILGRGIRVRTLQTAFSGAKKGITWECSQGPGGPLYRGVC